jgi:hypothetical protein
MVGLGVYLVWLELGDWWLLLMFIGKMFDMNLRLKFL